MRNTAESTEAGSGKIIRDLSGDLFVDLLDDLFGDLIFAGKAGFPGLRRLNNNRQQTTTDNRQQTTTTQIGAQNVTFQKSPHFSKFSENATPLSKIDESSKLLR